MNECLNGRHYLLFSGVFRWNGFPSLKSGSAPLGERYDVWWSRKSPGTTEAFLRYLNRYFYSTFMEAQFPETALLKNGEDSLPGFETYIDFCRREERLCHLTVKNRLRPEGISFFRRTRGSDEVLYELPLGIDYGDIYLYPAGTGLFSVKVFLEGGDVSFTHISDLVFAFREMNQRAFRTGGGERTSVELIQELFFEGSESGVFSENFTENPFNNKLKSFIVMEADLSVESEAERKEADDLLYEIATVSPVGTLGSGGSFAPSDSYMEKLRSENSLSVFKNWSALSLFDTFTVLFNKTQEHTLGCAYFNFEEIYFPIYILNLYLKCFCFSTNTSLSRNGLNNKANGEVRDRFIAVTNSHSFSHISYNFLPNVIHARIRQSLDLPDEIGQMEERIERINTFIDEKTEGRTNTILGFLSILALGSTFWDVSEWLQKLLHISDKAYSTVSFLLVLCTGAVCLGLFSYLNRKKR